MTLSAKLLGLALCAFVAIGVTAASSALAAVEHTFNVTATPVDLTADDDGGVVITNWGGVGVECSTMTLTGAGTETTEDRMTLTPTLSECKLAGAEVTITNEGCSYTFDSDTTADPNTGGESGTLQKTCEAGKFIKVVGPGCTIDMGAQGPLHGVRYTNAGDTPAGHEDITIDVHIFGTEYNATNNGCALLGITKGVHKDGTMLGNLTVRAYSKGKTHTTENQIGLYMTTP